MEEKPGKKKDQYDLLEVHIYLVLISLLHMQMEDRNFFENIRLSL